jgi:hypothetical protein
MQRIIPRFMEMKKRILENIVEGPIDEARFKLAQLNLADSGLGLFDSDLTSHAAFVASFAESMCDFVDNNFEIASQEDAQLPCVVDFLASIEVLKRYDTSISLETLIAKVRNGLAGQLQHQLSQIFRPSLRLEVMQLFPDSRAQVFLNSIRDSYAGKIS